MPTQLEIDFSAGEEPRKLIRARIQDLASSSMSESTSGINLPGKIAGSENENNDKTSGSHARRYKISSLF